MMGFGVLITLGVAAAIAYALGWRPQNRGQVRGETRGSALGILQERYARGEITAAEYEDMRRRLEAS